MKSGLAREQYRINIKFPNFDNCSVKECPHS